MTAPPDTPLAAAIRSQAVEKLRAENAKHRRRARDAEQRVAELEGERDALLRALSRAGEGDRTDG